MVDIMTNEILKLADDSIMFHWLIDRIATGYNYDMVHSLYKESFGNDITVDEFMNFNNKYAVEIRERYNALKREIYESGTYVKMQTIADRLYKMVNGQDLDLSPKELASLADTLRKYLEAMAEFGKTRVELKQVNNNTYMIFKGLEDEQLIKILNPSRLQYVLDGVVAEGENESD